MAETKSEPNAAFLRDVLKRAPFLVFSKTAPKTLPKYNTDTDFQYFFYGDTIQCWACLTGKFLRRGNRNAKADFPTDYKHIFEGDAEVMTVFSSPKFKQAIERLKRPGLRTIAHVRKTGAEINHHKYILGCLALYDDVELGITSFRSRRLSDEMPVLEYIPTKWYAGAFEVLPVMVAVVDPCGTVLKDNALMRQRVGDAAWDSCICDCMTRVREVRKIDRGKESWEFSRVQVTNDAASPLYRVWVWKPVHDKDMYAICFREHVATSTTGLPEIVAEALG